MDKDGVFSIGTLRQERALRLDGAMGTQILKFNLAEEDFRQGLPIAPTRDVKGDNECLNLTRPDVIRSIHRSYVEAGVDIIETNSFSANSLSQQDKGKSLAGPLDPRAADFAEKAATLRSLGAAILVKACDDHDQVIKTLTSAGIPSQDIVFEETIRS